MVAKDNVIKRKRRAKRAYQRVSNYVLVSIIKSRWASFKDDHSKRYVEVLNVEPSDSRPYLHHGADGDIIGLSVTVTYKSNGIVNTTETFINDRENIQIIRKEKLNILLK